VVLSAAENENRESHDYSLPTRFAQGDISISRADSDSGGVSVSGNMPQPNPGPFGGWLSGENTGTAEVCRRGGFVLPGGELNWPPGDHTAPLYKHRDLGRNAERLNGTNYVAGCDGQVGPGTSRVAGPE